MTNIFNHNTYSAQSARFLAPYACIPERSRGRKIAEPDSPGRSCYQRDRDRIIHCTAFRRLEYKTQVFLNDEGDHYRTRLTHSLEVAQLSRDTCRELLLEEDLGEAIALAHDLGHTPFGHAGEEALNTMMQPYGGFDHNAQTIRILTKLEKKYATFDGLNLSWECLEGIAKHNGPVTSPPRALAEYNQSNNLALNTYPNLEAQVSAICDDIAYNNHDIEDGLRSGILTFKALSELPLIGETLYDLDKQYSDLIHERRSYELRRRSIHAMIRDLVTTSQQAINDSAVKTLEDIHNANTMLISLSEPMQQSCATIKAFLYDNLYKHPQVTEPTHNATQAITDLFHYYMENPAALPINWQSQTKHTDKQEKAIIVTDFIAGMTDRYALKTHTHYKQAA